MQRFCLTLKLKNSEASIDAYLAHHRAVWPEVLASIRSAGVLDMEIYRIGNLLFMIMETTDSFSFEHKAQLDAANPAVQAWERLMEQFQDVSDTPATAPKWQPMDRIFSLAQALLAPAS